jgi:tRNA(Ile)-lysidine synthase
VPPAADRLAAGAAPVGDEEFAARLQPLGPLPAPDDPTPIGVAVSGGADSMCLALLAARWQRRRGALAPVIGLIVDHGLRAGSADEARVTAERLHRLGVRPHLLRIEGLGPGPALAARARTARYDLLAEACRSQGIVDLLLGHHAGDQAETVLMRREAGSGVGGLAGMAALVETRGVRLVRPLLGLEPRRLRATLLLAGLDWVEDPSNSDLRTERARLRMRLSDDIGTRTALLREAAGAGQSRTARDADVAALLAERVELRLEGYALLPPELLPAWALAPLIRMIGGREHLPPAGAVDALAADPAPCTLAGVRLLAGSRRRGAGWLLLREGAAMLPAVSAVHGAVWDGRFRLDADSPLPAGTTLGPLGGERPMPARLPAAVLDTLPALRGPDGLLAVPHLGWRADGMPDVTIRFAPTLPATDMPVFHMECG